MRDRSINYRWEGGSFSIFTNEYYLAYLLQTNKIMGPPLMVGKIWISLYNSLKLLYVFSDLKPFIVFDN